MHTTLGTYGDAGGWVAVSLAELGGETLRRRRVARAPRRRRGAGSDRAPLLRRGDGALGGRGARAGTGRAS